MIHKKAKFTILFVTLCLIGTMIFTNNYFFTNTVKAEERTASSKLDGGKSNDTEQLGTTQIINQIQEITSSDGAASDSFGFSVSIDGDTAVIAAPFDDDNGAASGSAYIFTRSGATWTEQAKLTASDGALNDQFGISASIDGDTAVIGAYLDNTDEGETGSAYVFTRSGTTWTQQAKLTANDGTAADLFGFSVSIDGDTAVIGAHNASFGTRTGAAYVFSRSGTTWTQQAKLTANDAAGNDVFGFSVSIDGDTAVIGAYLGNTDEGETGSAYVFTRSGATWTQQAKLTANDRAGGDAFGFSVSIEGDTAVIGAWLADDTGSDSGSAYVFSRSGTTWTEQAKLTASDGATGDAFGFIVSIDGDTAVVGAWGNDDNGNESGSAYVYTRSGTTWTEYRKLLVSNGAVADRMSFSVANSGTTVISGAPLRDTAGAGNNNQGSAYLFDPSASPFGPNPVADFDGDGKTDVSIFRPAPAQWWFLRSSDGGNNAFQFGQTSDTLVPADFTGDGTTDVAFWRESTGEWFVLRSEDQSFFSFPFGTTGDIPAPGDYDGDGKADAAIFRPSSATWFINRSSDGNVDIIPFGTNGDKPVIADYDGDGKDDIAIYRPSVSQWWINRSQDGVTAVQFGQAGDKTVQGDYTGDGKADVAFWRPTTGEWFVIRSEDNSFFAFPFGTNGDIPSPGDYDGDGKTDAAVFRPSSNTWFINGTTSGVQILGFGINGDVPLPSVYSVP